MRAWQTKTDNTAPSSTGILPAAEDNTRGKELENAVVTSGLSVDAYNAISDSDLYMLSQAMARYASGGVYGVDTGTANAYVVGAVSPFKVPKSLFTGMRVVTRPAYTNTGASVANVFSLGSKSVRTWDDAALVGGELVANRDTEWMYDALANSGAGAWRVWPWAVPRTTERISGLVALPATTLNVGSSSGLATLVSSYGSVINNFSTSTFSSGVLTTGAGEAGWYFLSCWLGTNLFVPGTGGTVSDYGWLVSVGVSTDGGSTYTSVGGVSTTNSANSVKGPFGGSGVLKYLNVGDKVLASVMHNSGVTQNAPVGLGILLFGK